MTPVRPAVGVMRRVIVNAFTNYVGKFVSVAAWIVMTPIILHYVSSSMYGLWVLVGSVVAYGALADFGIASAITKYVAGYRARGQFDEASRLVSTAGVIFLGLGLLVAVASVVVAPHFPRLFNVPPEQHATAVRLVVLSGLSLGVSFPCAATGAVLRGFQRFDLINVIVIMAALCGAGASILVLLVGGGVVGLVAAGIIVMLAMQIPTIWMIRRVAPELRFGFHLVSRDAARTVVSFSSSVFLLRIGGKLESGTDEIVIGALLSMPAVTAYSLARRLSTLPQLLTEQFLTVIVPLASELEAGNDQRRLQSLYVVSTRMTLAVCIPVATWLVLFAGSILTVWVGEEYAQYGHLVAILTIAAVIDVSVWPAGFVLQGIARHRVAAVASVCAGILNLGFSLGLIGALGLTGVALGTLIPTTFICLGWVTPYAKRVLQVPARDVIMGIFLPSLLPVLPTAIIVLALREMMDVSTLFGLVVAGMAAVGSYAVIYLSLAVTAIERRVIRTAIMDAARLFQLPLFRGDAG